VSDKKTNNKKSRGVPRLFRFQDLVLEADQC